MATKTKLITLLIEPSQLAVFNDFAQSHGITRSELIRDSVAAHIALTAQKRNQQVA
ncbi:MAG: hypothetical protein ACK5QS_17565 [Pseudanabaenaceae cyanobacterium]